MDLKEFKNPGKEYRTSPFWAWNDELSNEEIRWQIREMKKQGFGGYFIHSRVGLKTPYLSKDWMDKIKNALAEGRKQDMETWLYDEDKWPSGVAGGLVTEEKEEYRAKSLVKIKLSKNEVPDYFAQNNILAVFALTFDKKELISYYRINSNDELNEQNNSQTEFYVFKSETQASRNWFNGQSYVDVLNPEAIKKFIDTTHRRYRDNFAQDFGEYMPGIFTDEPTFRSKPANTLAWSLDFEGYFYKINGYNLLEKLPLLFYEFKDSKRVRYNYYYTLTMGFVNSYTKQIYEFCDQNNFKYTGHYLREDTLYEQTGVSGAVMPHYKYMHIPGIDHLGRNINDPLTLKQCASVAHQYDKKRVICENFGVSGHSMTFEDQKWIADFHFALGITFICQHLSLYSMVGDRKRDYPPTFSYHQPYWSDYKTINDYFARAAWICSQGDYQADVLVLHPIASVWANYTKSYQNNKYDRNLLKLQDSLLSAQLAFDYGDEILMREDGEVIESSDGVFIKIGKKALYKLLIIPSSLTWSQNIYNLLKKFINKGGQVIIIEEIPTMIEGKPALKEWEGILDQKTVYKINQLENMVEKIRDSLDKEVVIRDKDNCSVKDIYLHSRKIDSKYIFFLFNKSRELSYNLIVDFPVRGQIKELDLQTAEIRDFYFQETDKGISIEADFFPVGSRVFILETDKDIENKSLNMLAPKEDLKQVSQIDLSPLWDFQRLHKNSLTLDYCQYAINGGEWSKELPVWKIRQKIWYEAGLGEYEGIQPWVMEKKNISNKEDINLKLKFEFYAEIGNLKAELVIEKASYWGLKVNGQGIKTDTAQYYWDKQFALIDISKYIIKGENIVEIDCCYQYGIEIEDIYLVGEFAVEQRGYKDYALIQEPAKLKDGSWVYQGYPFYAGNMLYQGQLKIDKEEKYRYYLKLNNPQGTLYKVRINDNEWINLFAQPWEVDITEQLNDNKNDIEIEVVGSLRNTFGPLHHRLKRQAWTGPEEFVDEDNWVDLYQFEDYGLINGASILVRTVV